MGLQPWIVAVGLLIGMLVCLELGGRAAKRDPSLTKESMTVVEGALFTLLGLILAFSFSTAVTRFDQRRLVAVEEANAIGTAYLRFDLLPQTSSEPLKAVMRDYLDARLEFNRSLSAPGANQTAVNRTKSLQQELWTLATQAVSEHHARNEPMLILPALNDVFDRASDREIQVRTETPGVVVGLMIVLSLCCAFIAGRMLADAGRATFAKRLLFGAAIATTLYVVLDLDHPREGLIRVDYVDQLLVDLKDAWAERP